MNDNMDLFGAIDAGGTTFKCAVVNACGDILERQRIPTTTPAETIQACATFFSGFSQAQAKGLSSVGIAAFGPLDIDPKSADHGTILKTTKPGWSMTPVKQAFSKALGLPVYIDTDVNGALRAELFSGAAKGCRSAAYMTVGTGIGAGIFVNRGFSGAPSHPEFGHVCVKRHPADQSFEGLCKFHGDCLEGLASAAAFEARYGDPKQLPADHIGWQIEAFYLAQACINLHLSMRLERIILGGGLMQAEHLISLVRSQFLTLNGDYLSIDDAAATRLITLPGHGHDAGLMGAARLAMLGADLEW
ncbi:MAG: ROK family protein [Henriciella sp.]|nr:ROK family protein [Henriciella sp.]